MRREVWIALLTVSVVFWLLLPPGGWLDDAFGTDAFAKVDGGVFMLLTAASVIGLVRSNRKS